jgi:hypothetical protein
MRISGSLLAAIIACFLITKAGASSIPYADVGQVNQQSYSLAATETGSINVWFAGKGTATHENLLTAFVNGTWTGIVGLDNHDLVISGTRYRFRNCYCGAGPQQAS